MYVLQFQLFLVPIVESAELSQEIFSSKIEDLVEFSPNVERVQQISYLSQGQGIMDEIESGVRDARTCRVRSAVRR
jgi:hypothetical protein